MFVVISGYWWLLVAMLMAISVGLVAISGYQWLLVAIIVAISGY